MNPTLLLAIATLALVVGPLLDRLARRMPAVPALIDGATVGGIVIVSLLHLLPEAGAHLGGWALPLLACGLALPAVAEKLIEHGAERLRVPLGVLIVLLLLAHEVIESAALASNANEERVGIATLLVVVGHRLPLGLFLWGHAKRRFGRAVSVVALIAVASLTWFGPVLVPVDASADFQAVLSALLAGGLLHLVLQHPPEYEHGHVAAHDHGHGGGHDPEHGRRHVWSALGMVVAVGFFVPFLMGGVATHGHEHADVASTSLPERLRELALDTAPMLLAGALAAAAIEAFVPGSTASLLSRATRTGRALAGAAVGAALPVGSCGVLPQYRSLLRAGIAPAAGLALLVAVPSIGVDSLLLSAGTLGPGLTVARALAAVSLAAGIGLIVGPLASRSPARAGELAGDGDEAGRREPLPALRRGLLETWGHLSPWILLGLVVTAVVEPWISTEWAASTPAWVQVVVLALAGMPTYVGATASTPFAAMLLDKGFAPGAVIAFLLTGPATNLALLAALRRLHSTAVALALAGSVLLAAIAFGLGLGLADLRGAPAAEEHDHGALAWGSASILAALTGWVLFRNGPRAYLAQLWSVDPEMHRSHAHGETHGRSR